MKSPGCCPFSHRQATLICTSPTCKIPPFICTHCKSNLCQNQHLHGSPNSPPSILPWPQIHHTVTNLISLNGFSFQQLQDIKLTVDSVVTKLRETVQKMLGNVRKLKQKGIVKMEFKKTMERFRCAPGSLAAGQLGRLLEAASREELLENREDVKIKVKDRLRNVEQFLGDITKRIQQQAEEEANEFKRLLKSGEEYRKNRKYQEAINVYTDALEIHKDSDLVYFCRGFVYDEMADYQKALEHYNKAIQLNNKDHRYFNNRGILFKTLNKLQQSVSDYTKAITLKDSEPDYYFNRAIVYRNLNDFKKAELDFNRAIQLNPRSAEYFNGRGVFWKIQKEFERAVEDYSSAISLVSNCDNYYSNRAMAYATIREFEKAVQDFSKAIQLNPSDPVHYRNRSLVYEKMNRKNQALTDRTKVKELDQALTQR